MSSRAADESTPATVGLEGEVAKVPSQGPRRQYVKEDTGMVRIVRLSAATER